MVSAARSAGTLATDTTRRVAAAGVAGRDVASGIGANAAEKALAARDTLVEAAVATVDGAIDTRNAVVAYASATTDAAVIVASGLAVKGFVVSAIVAPIPTLVGAILMDMMLGEVSDRIGKASDDVRSMRAARLDARAMDEIAKHGRIPATALVETDALSLELDTVGGTVKGRVKSGSFEGRSLEVMTEDDIRSFASSSDVETASMLVAYMRYRKRTAGM